MRILNWRSGKNGLIIQKQIINALYLMIKSDKLPIYCIFWFFNKIVMFRDYLLHQYQYTIKFNMMIKIFVNKVNHQPSRYRL
jgi:hypothetical protein